MLPDKHPRTITHTMKMKYLLLLAALMFTFGAPMADAAPKKSKKGKAAKKVQKAEDEVMTIEEYEEEQARLAEEEAEAYAKRSGADRREEAKAMKEDTKFYIGNQKQTLKILKKVRNDKSATKAVKELELIYGKVEEMSIAEGTTTALGTVVYLEEEEENIPVHQASRAVAAALNKAINKEIKRIEELKLENAKFNAALQRMMEAQRQ